MGASLKNQDMQSPNKHKPFVSSLFYERLIGGGQQYQIYAMKQARLNQNCVVQKLA
jgi:hypothetical protein